MEANDVQEQTERVEQEHEVDKEEEQERLQQQKLEEEWRQEEMEGERVPGRILDLAGLTQYSPENAKKAFRMMEERMVTLSRSEFIQAVQDSKCSLPLLGAWSLAWCVWLLMVLPHDAHDHQPVPSLPELVFQDTTSD